jgi:hypothetical protein
MVQEGESALRWSAEFAGACNNAQVIAHGICQHLNKRYKMYGGRSEIPVLMASESLEYALS